MTSISTTPSDYKTILVGYDGSENAVRALARAAALAKQSGADLRIVVVVSTIVPAYGPMMQSYPAGFVEQILEGGKRLLSRAIDTAKQDGVEKVYGSVEDGHTADLIVTLATHHKADLIVLGRRGISGIERLLLGSVSSAVVSHSKCDVLIVR